MPKTIVWSPKKILELGNMWLPATLHTAVKLGIFDAIGDRSATLVAVMQKTKTSQHGTEPLLNALAAAGLLIKKNNQYRNTSVSKNFLCSNSKKYLGASLLHHHYLMHSWIHLDQSVTTGKAIRHRATSQNPAQRTAFYQAMNATGLRVAPLLAKKLNFKEMRTLLDLGGGPATYACHFCLHNPQLKAFVFDLGFAKAHAQKNINQFKMQKRVSFIEGNYLTDPLPGQYDAIFLSHILHAESPERCQLMIQKAVRALNPGGKILIQEFVMNDNKDGPLFPALFALNMLIGTDGGTAYSQKEIAVLLKAAGVNKIRHLPFIMPNGASVICATV